MGAALVLPLVPLRCLPVRGRWAARPCAAEIVTERAAQPPAPRRPCMPYDPRRGNRRVGTHDKINPLTDDQKIGNDAARKPPRNDTGGEQPSRRRPPARGLAGVANENSAEEYRRPSGRGVTSCLSRRAVWRGKKQGRDRPKAIRRRAKYAVTPPALMLLHDGRGGFSPSAPHLKAKFKRHLSTT